ncbi:uncharacterized protein LOC100210878 isoform X5 [Hydra vulgaris]|uniref:Uncharacterized protein LOC100210878 isoform X5 n=1 Tax=Hydra vulgaris TaxID=6087 RepID=A0ABM4CXL3_HYDVU
MAIFSVNILCIFIIFYLNLKFQLTKEVLDNNLSNKAEGCPITFHNYDDTLQISADCEEGASFSQLMNENESDNSKVGRLFPLLLGLNLKQLTQGIFQDGNMLFTDIYVNTHLFKFTGSLMNTLHFADGSLSVSDVKIKKLELEIGEKDFCNIVIDMSGKIELNGQPFEISLTKTILKCFYDVKIAELGTMTIEELVSTFKTSLENIQELKEIKKNELKLLTLLNPTIIGEVAADGHMQLLVNAEVNDNNLSLTQVSVIVIIDKKKGENTKLAIVFNINKGKSVNEVLFSLLSNSNTLLPLPIIGKLNNYDWVLSIAEGDKIVVLTPTPIILPVGITARIEISKEDYENGCGSKSPDVPQTVSIELRIISSEEFLFKMVDGLHDYQNFIKCLSNDKNITIDLPEQFTENSKEDKKITISHFTFNGRNGGFNLRLSLQKNISFFNDIFHFENFHLQLKKEKEKWYFLGNSTAKKSFITDSEESLEIESLFKISMKYDEQKPVIEFLLPPMNFFQLLSLLGQKKEEFDLMIPFKQFSQIGLSDVVLQGGKEEHRLSATAFFYGLTIQIDCIIWQHKTDHVTWQHKTDVLKKESKNKTPPKKEKLYFHSNHSLKPKFFNGSKILLIKKNDAENNVLNEEQIEKMLKYVSSKLDNGSLRINKKIHNIDKENSENMKNNVNNKVLSKNAYHFFRPSFFSKENQMLQRIHNLSGNEIEQAQESGKEIVQTQGLFTQSPQQSNISTFRKNKDDSVETVMKVPNIMKEFQKLPFEGTKKNKEELSDNTAHHENLISDSIDTEFSKELEELEETSFHLDDEDEPQNNLEGNNLASVKRSGLNKVSTDILFNNHTLQNEPLNITNEDQVYKRSSSGISQAQKTHKSFDKETPLKFNIVFTLTFINIRLSDLIEKLYEKSFMSTAPWLFTSSWLGKMSAVIFLSNTNTSPGKEVFKNWKKEKVSKSATDYLQHGEKIFEDLLSVKIKKGITASLTSMPLECCKNNGLCEWLKEVIGEEKIILTGFFSKKNIYLEAPLHIHDGRMKNENMDVQISALVISYNEITTDELGIYVTVSVNIKLPLPFSATGIVSLQSSGRLKFDASFIPKQKVDVGFGIGKFLYQNIHAKYANFPRSLIFQNGYIMFLEILVELKLGVLAMDGSEDHMITFDNAIININPILPWYHFVIAYKSDLTLPVLINAIYPNASIPKYLLTSIFPNGLQLTITGNEDGVRENIADIEIQSGCHLNGNIRIFEFFVPANVNLLPNKIVVEIKLNPIDVMGGLIKLRHSKKLLYNGPVLTLELDNGKLKSSMKALVDVMGRREMTTLMIENEEFFFNISGGLHLSLTSEFLFFKAMFSAQFIKADFKFTGCMKLFELKELSNKLIAELSEAHEEIVLLKTNIDVIVNSIQLGLKDALFRVNVWKKSIHDYEETLKEKLKSINNNKIDIGIACKTKCSEVCIPFFGWNNQCYRIWRTWLGCPTWDNCKWKKKDAICIASCELDKTAKKILMWGDHSGVDAFIGLTELPRDINFLLEQFSSQYHDLLTIAKQIQLNVTNNERTVKNIINNAKILLKKLCFNGFLNKFWKSTVFLSVNAEVYGKLISWEDDITLGFNLHNRLAKQIINKCFPELNSETQKSSDPKSFYAISEQLKNQHNELLTQMINLQVQVESATAERSFFSKNIKDAIPRGSILTNDYIKYRSILEEPLYDRQSAESMYIFQFSSHWSLLQDFDYNIKDVPLYDSDQPESAEKGNLDSCKQMKRVVEKYEKLTEGMKIFTNSADNQRQMFQSNKKMSIITLTDMQKKISDVEMRTNLSVSDVQDMLYWYNIVKKGLNEWNTKSEEIFMNGQKRGLIAFKNQMEFVLKRQQENSIRDYISRLHEDGMTAYKRSNMPNFNIVRGGVFLNDVKKAILNLYNDTDSPLEDLLKRVANTESKIEQLKSLINSCQ